MPSISFTKRGVIFISIHGFDIPETRKHREEKMEDFRKVEVRIRKNETGETRVYEDELLFQDNEIQTFSYEDGNSACDCNRRLYFARAKNENEDHVSGCGLEEYSVNIYDENGKMIYQEFEEK